MVSVSTDANADAPLAAIICGLEHSGTTIVAEVLRQVPGLDAGWEIGVLLAPSPRGFPALEPYAEWSLSGWGITRDTLLACCDTEDFAVFYRRLLAAATRIRPGTRRLFDKTPRYLASLDACLARAAAPCVVLFKDPRATVHSDFVRSGGTDFDRWFDAYAEPKRGYMRLHYAQFRRAVEAGERRVLAVRLETLVREPEQGFAAIFAHLGLPFRREYVAFETFYHNVRPGGIQPDVPFLYRDALTPAQQNKVAREFGEFALWFT